MPNNLIGYALIGTTLKEEIQEQTNNDNKSLEPKEQKENNQEVQQQKTNEQIKESEL